MNRSRHLERKGKDMTSRTNNSNVETVRRSFEAGRSRARMLSSKFWVPFASFLLWAEVGYTQVVVSPVAIGVGGYGGWDGVGTAESSAAHGYADLIRSEGYYNMATAEGAVYAEQARSLYLQNRREALQAYWAGKEQRAAINAQKRELNRHSAEALNLAAKSALPQPLSNEVFNPETGQIAWPTALLDSEYTAKRRQLEKLLEQRARTSSGPNSQTSIKAATGELVALLKSNITRTAATDYMKARKFLDSLAVSAG
jgi:hypothetical protein